MGLTDLTCEVCQEKLNGPVLNLGSHPIPDDLVPIGSNPTTERFEQKIKLCSNCLTAVHLHQVPKERLFRSNYHYRAALTLDVVNGMRSLVDRSLPYLKSSINPVILDIGCNDGTLLNLFKQKIGCRTVGIDPGVAISVSENPPDFALQDYFDDKSSDLIAEKFPKIDLITFTNVFAHIEDLGKLCKNLKKLISDTSVVIIENHYLGSILETHQFDTFYHEHPRTYSIKSFEFIAELLDLTVLATEFPSRYGGNIRVVMSRKLSSVESTTSCNLEERRVKELSFPDKFDSVQKYFIDWGNRTKIEISKLVSDFGPFLGKSLPARAVMLISALDLDLENMLSIYERPTSPKVGNLVPGTNIPILSDALIPLDTKGNIIVWSWHIISEIEPYLRQLGFRGPVWVPLPSFTRIS